MIGMFARFVSVTLLPLRIASSVLTATETDSSRAEHSPHTQTATVGESNTAACEARQKPSVRVKPKLMSTTSERNTEPQRRQWDQFEEVAQITINDGDAIALYDMENEKAWVESGRSISRDELR